MQTEEVDGRRVSEFGKGTRDQRPETRAMRPGFTNQGPVFLFISLSIYRALSLTLSVWRSLSTFCAFLFGLLLTLTGNSSFEYLFHFLVGNCVLHKYTLTRAHTHAQACIQTNINMNSRTTTNFFCFLLEKQFQLNPFAAHCCCC